MRRSLAAVAVALLLTGCSGPTSATHDSSPGDDYFGAVLDQPYTAPDVTLTATDNAPQGTSYNFRSSSTTPLTLIFFGYTNCPDVCAAVMSSLTSALARLDDAQRAQVQVVFVTTDPRRDDTTQLGNWLSAFDPGYIGLTGPISQIVEAGKAFHVYVSDGQPLPGGGYDVTHGAEVIAVDDHDRSPIVWTEGTSSAQFATDLTRILEHPLETS